MTPARLEAQAELKRNPPAPLSQWPAEVITALRALLAVHEDEAAPVTAQGRQRVA